MISAVFASIGRYIEGMLIQTGLFARFFLDSLRWTFRKPFRWKLLLEQMEKIGVNSILVITLSSLTVGMIFSLESTYMMRMFQAETFVGAMVGMILGRELAPVMTALMLIAKNGSSMAAEIGTMKVTEQIDAMETMAVSPIHYLVVPRMLAAIIVFPLLTAIANVVGVIGAYFVAVQMEGVDGSRFMERLYYWVDPRDIYSGLIKAAVMGLIVTLISCFCGLMTKNGAKGVGESTTRAVVSSSVAILIADYILSDILIKLLFQKLQ